ncbi:hypothetical protein [Legionella genomosp. 1]
MERRNDDYGRSNAHNYCVALIVSAKQYLYYISRVFLHT